MRHRPDDTTTTDRAVRTRSWLFASILACSQSPAPPTVNLAFDVDAPTGSELYTCYAFDTGSLDHRWMRAIAWAPPTDGSVIMHHATLYAVTDWSQGDVSTCIDMPSPATGLDVWVPGSDSLALPDDIGVELPPGASKLIVQVHAIRVADGPPVRASVTITTTSTPPAKVAAWLPMTAPIPALRPHMTDASTAACTVAGDVHVIRDWPHMHMVGKEFHGAVVHADGTTTPLVDVVPWDFYRQVTYVVDAPIARRRATANELRLGKRHGQLHLRGPAHDGRNVQPIAARLARDERPMVGAVPVKRASF